MTNKTMNVDFVVPGDKVGVIEEYEHEYGTYEHDGVIRASVMGGLKKDPEKHVIAVKAVKELPLPKPKDKVYALVASTSSKTALVMILSVGDKLLGTYLTGLIYAGSPFTRSVLSIRHSFKPGDIVRCEVLSFNNGVYHLRAQGSNLGVVYATCSRCGSPLVKTGKELKCQTCDNVERRKIAKDYGAINLRWLL